MKTKALLFRFFATLSILASFTRLSAQTADLGLSAALYSPGDSMVGLVRTYMIVITNAGPDTATGVTLKSQLPPDVELTTVSAGQAVITAQGAVSITFDTLPAGQSLAFDLSVLAESTILNSANSVNPGDFLRVGVTNSFTVSANETDPNPANNSAGGQFGVIERLPGTPVSGYDLEILQLEPTNRLGISFVPQIDDQETAYGGGADAPAPPDGFYALSFGEGYPGDVVILAGNDSSNDANINITNWLAVVRFFNPADPDGVDLSADMKQAYFSAAAIGPDGFTNFNLLPTAIYVTGYATASNGLVDVDANYDTEAIGPTGELDYYTIHIMAYHLPTGAQLSATGDPQSIVVGNLLTYSLALSNSMTRMATGIVISNGIRPDLQFVSATGGTVTSNNGALFISAASLAPGATNLIQLVMRPIVVEDLTNLFHVTSDQGDPDPNAGYSSVFTTVNDVTTRVSADISVTTTNFIALDEYNVLVYSNLICYMTVSNAGPATATGIVLTDQLPPHVNFVSESGGTVAASGSNGTVEISLDPLLPGATNQVRISVEPTIDYLDTTLGNFAYMTNNFQVTANEADPVAANNTTNVIVGVTTLYPGLPVAIASGNPGGSEFFVSVFADSDTAAATHFGLSSMEVAPGDFVMLNGTNGGLTNFNNWAAVIRFFNPSDPNFTIGLPATEAQAYFPSSVAGGQGFTNYTLAPNVTYTLIQSGSLPILVDAETENFGPVGAVNPGQLGFELYFASFIPASDLGLTAAVLEPAVHTGSNLVFSLSVTNAGPQAATDVIISNVLSPNVSYISSTVSATLTNGNVLLDLGPMAIGATAQAQLVLQPTSDGEFTNQFQVESTNADPVLSNNIATLFTSANELATTADLSLTAQGSPGTVPLGSNVVFSLAVSNAGPVTASGLVITSPFATNLHFLWATGVGSTSFSSNGLSLTLGALGSGSSELVQIVAQATAAGQAVNQFSVSANQPDFNTANNIAQVISTVPGTRFLGAPPTFRIVSPQAGHALNGQVTLEFSGGTPGIKYDIEYSSNLMVWLNSATPIVAATNSVQWIDAGPPITQSAPSSQGNRYYRAAQDFGN